MSTPQTVRCESSNAGAGGCSTAARRLLTTAGVLAAIASLGVEVTCARAGVASPVLVTITGSKVKVSAASVLVGLVVFKIVNASKAPHGFAIAGKKTPWIAAGKSATLRVTIANTGPYVYYAVDSGRRPVKGAISVVEPCTSPTSSTITVQMAEMPIVLSQATVPCGTVTFVVTNAGTIPHSFDLFQANPPHTLARGPRLQPGQTTNLVVSFTQKGSVQYLCGEEEHTEEYGENGVLTVT